MFDEFDREIYEDEYIFSDGSILLSEDSISDYLNQEAKLADEYRDERKDILRQWDIDPNMDNAETMIMLGFYITRYEEYDPRSDEEEY